MTLDLRRILATKRMNHQIERTPPQQLRQLEAVVVTIRSKTAEENKLESWRSQFDSDESTRTSPVHSKYSFFRSKFNRKGDVIYGFQKPRATYIKEALGTEAMALGHGAPTVDAYNRWIVPVSEVEAKAEMPAYVSQYHSFLKSHPKEKYRELADRIPARGHNHRRKIIRSCKAKIEETVASGHIIHFVLDKSSHEWNMSAVVAKDSSVAHLASVKELRFMYMNRKLATHFLFWKEGNIVKAPWDEDPALWESFESKKSPEQPSSPSEGPFSKP